MKTIANYHTHTTRCKHAFGTEREFIEQAIRAGFQILGFSDHVPQPYPADYTSGIRMAMEEAENYTSTLSALKEEYKNEIEILIGYEAEYSTSYFREMLAHLRQYPLDYLILGQHFVPDEVHGIYVGRPVQEETILEEYVDLCIEAIDTGLFSYIAHPDILYYIGNDHIYQKHMRRLIEKAKVLQIPLEINMLGFTLNKQYPGDRFFAIVGEIGADCILGCDAHTPEQLCQPDKLPGLTQFIQKHDLRILDGNLLNRSL